MIGDTFVDVDGVEYLIVWDGGEGLISDRTTKPSQFWTPPKRIYNKRSEFWSRPRGPVDKPGENLEDPRLDQKLEWRGENGVVLSDD